MRMQAYQVRDEENRNPTTVDVKRWSSDVTVKAPSAPVSLGGALMLAAEDKVTYNSDKLSEDEDSDDSLMEVPEAEEAGTALPSKRENTAPRRESVVGKSEPHSGSVYGGFPGSRRRLLFGIPPTRANGAYVYGDPAPGSKPPPEGCAWDSAWKVNYVPQSMGSSGRKRYLKGHPVISAIGCSMDGMALTDCTVELVEAIWQRRDANPERRIVHNARRGRKLLFFAKWRNRTYEPLRSTIHVANRYLEQLKYRALMLWMGRTDELNAEARKIAHMASELRKSIPKAIFIITKAKFFRIWHRYTEGMTQRRNEKAERAVRLLRRVEKRKSFDKWTAFVQARTMEVNGMMGRLQFFRMRTLLIAWKEHAAQSRQDASQPILTFWKEVVTLMMCNPDAMDWLFHHMGPLAKHALKEGAARSEGRMWSELVVWERVLWAVPARDVPAVIQCIKAQILQDAVPIHVYFTAWRDEVRVLQQRHALFIRIMLSVCRGWRRARNPMKEWWQLCKAKSEDLRVRLGESQSRFNKTKLHRVLIKWWAVTLGERAPKRPAPLDSLMLKMLEAIPDEAEHLRTAARHHIHNIVSCQAWARAYPPPVRVYPPTDDRMPQFLLPSNFCGPHRMPL
ncbi:hypothetical protein CYMTET_31491 [Cymbomonas tetramitiformis]|uniref:Sfi1 spindle body domain-containing protein n=1 Tax=Cymbomonas tetramitiformis TaxID=36881 RepID=A0AAE0FH42_9CHLO|nr:hypothetical protein CYMTET_31491 [Cymbomonas tetramitiformis]